MSNSLRAKRPLAIKPKKEIIIFEKKVYFGAAVKPIYCDMILTMIQGKIVPADEAQVSVWDRGYYFGDGIYEVIQAYNGKLWGFEQHFKRFERSLKEIKILNVDIEQVRRWVLEAFEKSNEPNATIYFQITRGCGMRTHAPSPTLGEPQFFLYISPGLDNSEDAANGIAAISYPDIRWKRCDIKSLNLLPNVMACQAAEQAGAQDALFIDEDKIITESAAASFFGVINGRLITRQLDRHILPSITRLPVLIIAEEFGVEIEQRAISLEEAYKADELFIAASSHEIRGIVKLDGKQIGDGKPGPITSKIIKRFNELTRSETTYEELAKNTKFTLMADE